MLLKVSDMEYFSMPLAIASVRHLQKLRALAPFGVERPADI